MSCPANSPDLNPIEHIWDMLGRQIAALSYPPSSVTELKRALQEAWNRLSPQLIHHLIGKLSENESDGGLLSCSNLDSDEDIRLRENNCEESEESEDAIDNIPVNPDIYVARHGTECNRII
ncbi:transposable element Tcb2 transposase [Trichonephila clavipes]|nr:transposable element Tcb2 transposase [Trichonephila clavipes]